MGRKWKGWAILETEFADEPEYLVLDSIDRGGVEALERAKAEYPTFKWKKVAVTIQPRPRRAKGGRRG